MGYDGFDGLGATGGKGGCAAGPQATSKAGAKGGPAIQGSIARVVPAKGSKAAGKGKGNTEADAFKEIELQLMDSNNAGKVVIKDWVLRYGNLATSLRKFLEARPERFLVWPGNSENDFTVDMLAGDSIPAAKAGNDSSGLGTEKEALAEITEQIVLFDKVDIPDWNTRYRSLGNCKEFMEKHPDRFTIIPGDKPGSYTVEIARDDRPAPPKKQKT